MAASEIKKYTKRCEEAIETRGRKELKDTGVGSAFNL